MQVPPSRRFKFGAFEADVRAGELTKSGRRLSLQDQPFQLLTMLLEKKGEVVTREELRNRLWPATTVDFDHGMNKAVSKVREALGDSAENPRFVETVARRGYRFLADVTIVADSPSEAPATLANVEQGTPTIPAGAVTSSLLQSRLPYGRLIFGAALVLMVAVVGTIVWLSYPSPAIRSLAVLPLGNLSGDAKQDYFVDGMTEELINRLGQIGSLRVISRTSVMTFKGVRKSLSEIGHDLNVEGMVEGSVLRQGDRVRVIVQLIQVPDERRLWSQSYDEPIEDALALQSKITSDIAEHIRVTLNVQEKAKLAKSKPLSTQAYDDYLKGRYFSNKRSADDLKVAISHFNRAIEKEPAYAEAYSGLADAYALSGDWEYGGLSPREAFAKSMTASIKALALDGSLSQAHTSLAFALDLYSWDWAAAEAQYKQAIELNPGYATAHHWYAWHLLTLGRTEEGLAELRLAERLDPLSLIISSDLADALSIAHRLDESLRQSRKTLELDRNFALAHYQLGQVLVQKKMTAEAEQEFRKAIDLSGHSAAFDAGLASAFAASGRKDEAINVAHLLESHPDQYPAAEANIASIYSATDEPDLAMVWLNKAYDAQFNPSILLRPAFEPLRANAQFQALRHRVGLPSN